MGLLSYNDSTLEIDIFAIWVCVKLPFNCYTSLRLSSPPLPGPLCESFLDTDPSRREWLSECVDLYSALSLRTPNELDALVSREQVRSDAKTVCVALWIPDKIRERVLGRRASNCMRTPDGRKCWAGNVVRQVDDGGWNADALFYVVSF